MYSTGTKTRHFHTLPLYFYAISKLSKSFFCFHTALREEESVYFCYWSPECSLLFSPAPLLFSPACGASSCCCCPPALCSCSSEEPLQAASRSLSQSPACREREINQCVCTGSDVVKYCTGTLVTLPHQCAVSFPQAVFCGSFHAGLHERCDCYLHFGLFSV